MQLLLKQEVNGQYQKRKTDQMIYPERLVLEKNKHEYGENGKRYRLLYDFQLPYIEWTAVPDKTNAIGWYLTAILKQGDAPAEQDYQR